jgi:PPOX class probable F420-dependent enzyme
MSGNRREQIRMDAGEQAAFIAAARSLQVATINRDGSPHLSTLWFAMVDDAIVFETYTRSQKIKNLQRDPRIACLVEDGAVYDELRGVQINGTAELVTAHDAVHRLAHAVMVRNNPTIAPELLDEAARHMAAKRTAVIVHPERVVSWDHTKLGGTY